MNNRQIRIEMSWKIWCICFTRERFDSAVKWFVFFVLLFKCCTLARWNCSDWNHHFAIKTRFPRISKIQVLCSWNGTIETSELKLQNLFTYFEPLGAYCITSNVQSRKFQLISKRLKNRYNSVYSVKRYFAYTLLFWKSASFVIKMNIENGDIEVEVTILISILGVSWNVS